jgi:hypothetical protein
MAVLNEEYTWAQIGSIVTDPSTGGTVSDAFQLLFGEPTKDLIPAGMRLYKFNDFSSPARTNGADEPISPWWSPSLPYKHDGGLQQKLNIARLNGVSSREWGRLTSVVKEDWNSLSYIFEMHLKVPVYGWFGGFKGMSRSGGGASKRNAAIEKRGASRGLPGGGTQFYIPNLKLGMIAGYTIKPTESW